MVKDHGAMGVLDVRIKRYQGLMKGAKGFVTPAYMPSLAIELHLNHILCILAIVLGVHVDSCLLNDNLQRESKNVAPSSV